MAFPCSHFLFFVYATALHSKTFEERSGFSLLTTVKLIMSDLSALQESGAQTLQAAFSKFRERRMQEIKLARFNRGEGLDRSQEYKDNLRNAFIKSAQSYIGVPYSKRYKEEGAEDAPLYLDCCALVRRAVQDNQEAFGFLIGRWNQSYQLDTLPIAVESIADLRPGDLIFYEGIYTSPRSKPQKHNMVHVEIFLGGESTLGARLKRGVISIFPSYKFESASWTLVKVHFRSIDTWLNGQCVSHCTEHPWLEEANVLPICSGALKGSIFYLGAEDQSAGDDSDLEEDAKEQLQVENSPHHSAVRSTMVKSSSKRGIKSNLLPKRGMCTSTSFQGKPGVTNSYMARKTPLLYYVNKSNGWKLVQAALDKRGWQQIPFDHKFSTRFDLKWVERKSDIDYKANLDGQLVCHFPNNECITTKVQLLRTMYDFEASIFKRLTTMILLGGSISPKCHAERTMQVPYRPGYQKLSIWTSRQTATLLWKQRMAWLLRKGRGPHGSTSRRRVIEAVE